SASPKSCTRRSPTARSRRSRSSARAWARTAVSSALRWPRWAGANLRPMRPETGLWQDVSELPDSLAATIDARDGVAEVAALLGAEGIGRIVATGNGA